MAIGRLPAATRGDAGPNSGPGKTGPHASARRVGGRLGPLSPDRLAPSLAERLVAGNGLALRHAGAQVRAFGLHPLQSLAGVVSSVAGPFLHPVRTADRVVGTFGVDPVDGVVQATQIGSLYLAAGSAGLYCASFALAPFTAGASLAWLPVAGTLGTAAAIGGGGAFGLSLAKNEADIARARTPADLDAQARELGADFINAGLLAAAGGAGRAFRGAYQGSRFARKVNPASLKRVSGRANATLWTEVTRRLGIRPRSAVLTEPMPASRPAMQMSAVLEVQRYLRRNPLGRRPIRQITDLSPPPRAAALENSGWRLAYHGTQEKFAPTIRRNGLKSSDVGDYGHGIYLGNKPEVAINYADDAYLAHPGPGDGVVYSVEVAPGRIMDFLKEREAFMAWAKARFNPADLSDPVNRLYARSKTSVSPLVDVRWTRYVNRYMAEKGFDSILIRNRDSLGADYWMVPDPARVRLLQEFKFPQPTNRSALANGILGVFAPLMRLRSAFPLLRPTSDDASR